MAIDISDVLRRVVYAPNGTGPYQFTFEVLAQTDIAVYRGSTLLTLTTDYTVSLNVDGTGSVTLVTTAGTSNITIVGDRGIARSTDFVTGGDLLANSLNEELDAQTIFNQQTYELALRGLKAPVYDPTDINMTLPSKSSRANKTLSFDADGNPTPGVSAADVANAVTYATNAANSATAAAASASAAASSASSASSSASTATTQASNASTSASNASTSATNASNSASSASTSATNAATSETNASNSASAASTSATNASNSATAASTSASNASTSATNAANSATAAATSETNAATSAAAAAAALDNFDDRYLGAKSSNPTVDNDGNALLTGALYYRTTTPVGMKVYDGAQWLEASAAQQSLMVTYEFVATAGQTTFSGLDANGATLSYVANSISVSLNGVTLRPGDDYTATNGTSVVLNVAAALNDDLMVIAFAVFNVANAVAKTGDTMTGSLLLPAGTVSAPALTTSADTNTGIFFPAADTIAFSEGGVESMRIDSAGNVGIGTSSPDAKLRINGSATVSSQVNVAARIGASVDSDLLLGSVNGNTPFVASQGAFPLAFYTNATERARIDSSGIFLIAKTASSGASTGAEFQSGTGGNTAAFLTASGAPPLIVNRQAEDGTLVSLRQANTEEGSISVSGATVSYNAFAGSHWSQLQDGSKPEILRGTVMESIDELVQWPDEPTTERLCRSKVSDTAGSKRVYGVFMNWDNDWTATNDMLVTSLGAFICRVSSGVTVQMGDLLESNGDGTARVQADDIIRSSTIGKVTSTVKTHEYDDGSYCVPTVLYCG
jgi:hypothetical protein